MMLGIIQQGTGDGEAHSSQRNPLAKLSSHVARELFGEILQPGVDENLFKTWKWTKAEVDLTIHKRLLDND